MSADAAPRRAEDGAPRGPDGPGSGSGTWAGRVGAVLTVVGLAVAALWASQDLSIDDRAGLRRAAVALAGVVLGVAWSWRAGPPQAPSPSAPSTTDPSDTALWGGSWAVALAALGASALPWIRRAEPLAGVDQTTLWRAGTPWWGFLAGDAGLPSLLHRPLNLLAAHVGGLGLVLAVHGALYGVLVVMLWDLAVRLVGRVAGPAVVVAWATAPPVLEVFAGLRAYPSFLLWVLLAERAMVQRPGAERPDDRGVVRRLGLALLEIPSALSTLGAFTAGRLLQAPRPRGLGVALTALTVGTVPLALAARRMHAVAGRPPAALHPGLAVAGVVGLLLLADAWRARWQRPAVAAAVGSLGLIVGLVLVGVLDPEPRYAYQSGLLPLVLVAAWLVRRASAWVGPAVAQGITASSAVALAGLAAWLQAPAGLAGDRTGVLAGALGVLGIAAAGTAAAALGRRGLGPAVGLALGGVVALHGHGLWTTVATRAEVTALLQRGLAVGSQAVPGAQAPGAPTTSRPPRLCAVLAADAMAAQGLAALSGGWWAPTPRLRLGTYGVGRAGQPGCGPGSRRLWVGPAASLQAAGCTVQARGRRSGRALGWCTVPPSVGRGAPSPGPDGVPGPRGADPPRGG